MVLPQPMPIWVDAQATDMPKTASAKLQVKLQVIRVSADIGKKPKYHLKCTLGYLSQENPLEALQTCHQF